MCGGGGTGRRKGLKIPCPARDVPVRFRPSAPSFVAVKILAVQNNNTLQGLLAEAFNDVFAKYGKPEIAPALAENLE